ncbi:MAG: hypothetical protein CL566_03625 [Alphaproteobacteria bacterium]|jgi:hypothetical protein|nr:hypothetical protein [Alphaproteobacteria bacterium]|tara:strand:- start:426 stop:713 length:288 start_codon:yes stop_codon:yes gene_type:complete
MRSMLIAFAVAVPLLAAVPAQAQQIVETTTGKHAGGNCAVSQAMLAAIQGAQAERRAETRTRINDLLETALASSKSRRAGSGQSPVVLPPAKPGS